MFPHTVKNGSSGFQHGSDSAVKVANVLVGFAHVLTVVLASASDVPQLVKGLL